MKYTFLLIILCFAACNNSKNQEATYIAGDSTSSTVSQSSYYKRFSGTIAGQPVVLHLHKSEHTLSATYYYTKQGKPISLYMMADTTVVNGYTAEETPERRDEDMQASWKVVVTSNTIKGQWISADKKKTYDIDLKEDYPTGSYQLSALEINDSIPLKTGKPEPSASVYYSLLLLSPKSNADDSKFYEQVLLKELGDDSLKTHDVTANVMKQVQDYGKWYRETLADTPDSMLGEAFNNYYLGLEMRVMNNDNGWLIMEFNGSEYTGGAHGNYGVSYLNIDMQHKKLWKMEDILSVDSVKLQLVLETEGRKYFDIPAGEKLDEHILADKIMPNGNVYITATGIVFTYNPYEIASYADGIITLFIPYTKIKDLLKPAFKQRMGIQ